MHVLVTSPRDDHKRKLKELAPDWELVFADRMQVTADDVRPAQIILGNVPISVWPTRATLSGFNYQRRCEWVYQSRVLPPGAVLPVPQGHSHGCLRAPPGLGACFNQESRNLP